MDNYHLEEVFHELTSNFNAKTSYSVNLWSEIKLAHTSKKRHYHNLNHLHHIFSELFPIKSSINEWNMILFAIFYHDIVYSVSRKDNEEKSAFLAKQRLKELSIPSTQIDFCVEAIIATKSHNTQNSQDINYFTDADLAILGSSNADYQKYIANIRKEYSAYPDILYKSGRKKVLKRFLEMKTIYKTDYFNNLYENQSRHNLEIELHSLLSPS